jgi:hypothetical protein
VEGKAEPSSAGSIGRQGFAAAGGAHGPPGVDADVLLDEASAAIAEAHLDATGMPATGGKPLGAVRLTGNRDPSQKASVGTTKPSLGVSSMPTVLMLTRSLRNRTAPSVMRTLAPPGWKA